MKYFSTFSGIGGFEHAIHSVFPNAECMGYSEFNDFPVEMYRHSFPKHKNYGDITKIDFESLPDLDLICGGSPCQSHSRIGNGLGFDDPRGQLFFDYIRLIEVKRPKAFVFENVDSLAKGKKGAKNMELVLGSIIKAGYKPTYRFLKASDYCEVPQARERLFVIGIRNDIYDAGFRYKWPEKKPCSISFEDILDKPGEINPELFYDSDAIDSMLRMSYGTASAKKREIILGKDVELGGIIPGNIMVIGGCECGEGENVSISAKNGRITIEDSSEGEVSGDGTKHVVISRLRMNSAISYSYHAPISGESDTITETLKNKDGKERRERGFHQDSDRRYARTVVANISKGFPCDVIIDHTLCKMGTWDCEFAGTDEGWCDGCNRQNDFENYTPTIDGCASFRQWSPRELERIFGFPKGVSDVPGLSMTQKKKAFGNSVVVPLVAKVMEGLKGLFEQGKDTEKRLHNC